MKTLFRNMALAMGLLFGLAAGPFAEDFDPNVQARDSLRLTLEKQGALPHGKPTPQGIKKYAEHLMLIKNALSLYRDGYLSPQDRTAVEKLIKAQLDYTNAALAAAGSWPQTDKKLLRTLHDHALSANQLTAMPSDSPNFKGLMEAYHSGIGYDAYRAAEDLGIEQVWEEAL